MKNLLRGLIAAVGVSALTAACAFANAGVDGQPVRQPGRAMTNPLSGDYIMGIHEGNDTLSFIPRFTLGKALITSEASKDRDHWFVQGAGLQATDIAAGQIYKSLVPVTASSYSSVGLLVSWAVADTESVAVEVMVLAKTSTNPGDGLDFMVDMNPGDNGTDGVMVVNRRAEGYATALSYERRFYVPSATNYPAGGMVKGENIGTTTNAVYIPLSDIYNELLNFPIIQVWVHNRLVTQQMDDVTVEYWLKVK